MIRPPRPQSRKTQINHELRGIREQIAAYEQPTMYAGNPLATQHEARVRAKWDAMLRELRAREAKLLEERKGL